ncbi:MAG TPA: Gfo/Idh/MocA family oxidoreductase [Planctomycetota bacterium]|nr:Gfo/Idh/MocA family oxidoreductase [Planctomycetota bacterium]
MRRFIIVGLGGRSGFWLPSLPLAGVAEPVAFVEPNKANADARSAAFKLDKSAIYPTLAEAKKAHPEADSVIDIVTPMVREAVVSEAFSLGLNVLSEKPLAPTLEQAKRLLALSQKHNKTWMITQNYRFNPLPRTSRRVVESGAIGDIGVINLAFWKTGRFARESYYAQIDFPLLSDMMVHHMDMVRYVTGLDFAWLRASSFQPKWSWFKGDAGVTFTGEMTNGASFTHTGVWCSHGKNTTWNGDWHVEGSRGGFTWNQDKLDVHVPADGAAWDTTPASVNVSGGGDVAQMILREFDSAIEQKRQPECSAFDNLRSIGVIYAATESIKRGGEKIELGKFLGL